MKTTNGAMAMLAMLGLGACAGAAAEPAAIDGEAAPAATSAARQAVTSAAPSSTATSVQPVKVVNGATDWVAPVPTLAQGTTTVAGTVSANATQSGAWSVGINGTPTVNAQQSGAWSVNAQQSGPWVVTAQQGASPWSVSLAGAPTVGLAAGTSVAVSGSVSISNTPTVNVGNTPTVNIGNSSLPVTGSVSLVAGTQVGISGNPSVTLSGTPSVQLANTASNPALVRNTDEHARQPFQQTSFLYFVDGSNTPTQSVDFLVPANKRLVIDYVALSFNLPPGQVPSGSVFGNAAGMTVSVPAWPTKIGSVGVNDVWAFNGPFHVAGDGGTNLTVSGFRSGSTGFGNANITITGYFIDL